MEECINLPNRRGGESLCRHEVGKSLKKNRVNRVDADLRLTDLFNASVLTNADSVLGTSIIPANRVLPFLNNECIGIWLALPCPNRPQYPINPNPRPRKRPRQLAYGRLHRGRHVLAPEKRHRGSWWTHRHRGSGRGEAHAWHPLARQPGGFGAAHAGNPVSSWLYARANL